MGSNNKLMHKKILHPGNTIVKFQSGTKVTLHIKVQASKDNNVFDDSRKWSEPVEILVGKKFKLEVWEACVQTMQVGEISQFKVDKKLVASYPAVAKTLRDYHAKKMGKKVEAASHHCCGLGFKEGLGYPDLDDLIKDPQDLIFTIELLKVENDGAYQKEFWAMTEDEQLASLEILKQEGNELYKLGYYLEATNKYSEAIGRLDNLMLKEKPGDIEWKVLNDKKIPLLLNYSQCQLMQEEYYSVIEHCSEVLKHYPDNVKALFKRGKSYIKVFSPSEARSDLEKVVKLDPSLETGCHKLLCVLEATEKEKLRKDKEAYKNLFSK